MMGMMRSCAVGFWVLQWIMGRRELAKLQRIMGIGKCVTWYNWRKWTERRPEAHKRDMELWAKDDNDEFMNRVYGYHMESWEEGNF